MRRWMCVPMMILCLLATACGNTETTTTPEDAREAYRTMAGCTMEAVVSCRQEDGLDWENGIVGVLEEGEGNDRFLGYWNYATSHTDPLLLAEIPVEHPWQVFAWLPFGGWNECPGTGELMVVSAHWFRQHRAVPAVVTHDVLEYALPQPVAEDAALELAVEQYAFCPDIIDQAEDLTLGRLAGELACSRSWYFWWD